jgi:WD40 repeat protein
MGNTLNCYEERFGSNSSSYAEIRHDGESRIRHVDFYRPSLSGSGPEKLFLVSVSDDQVRVWNDRATASDARLLHAALGAGDEPVALVTMLKTKLVVSRGASLIVFDMVERTTHPLLGHQQPITALQVSSDSNLLISAYYSTFFRSVIFVC